MTILDDIVKNTRQKLIQKKADAPLEQIKSQLKDLKLPKGNFKENLLNKDQAIIAEIKKASPSAGIISEDFNPVKKATYLSVPPLPFSFKVHEKVIRSTSSTPAHPQPSR